MRLYPLLMAPSFRHGEETPWGGTMLRDIFLKDAPEDITGECLEVSDLPGLESMVANGEHAGKPLTRMIELWGEALTGIPEGPFPLLLKLLDTQQPLSVQVHPSDAAEGRPGKSKAWVILNAEPGAKVVYGLDTKGEDLRAIVTEGRLGDCLHFENVRPGDVFYLPSGTAYALCEGIQCYEIQPTGGVSYRLWDWDRVNAAGQARALQADEALDVCTPDRHLPRQEGTTVLCKGGSRTYYVSDANFELCRLNISGRMPMESGRMLFLTPLGPCALCWEDDRLELNPFDTVLVPAALEGLVIEGETKLMMSSLPNREALIRELSYRAENVSGLLDTSSAQS